MIAPPKLCWGLGTIGIKHGKFYADVFLKPYFGIFVADGIFRRWYKITWRGLKLIQVRIVDPTQAVRVLRRTMRPGIILDMHPSGHQVECMSYPCYDEARGVVVYARTTVGEPLTARYLSCERLRPMNFVRRTGIPSCDPLEVK